MKNIKSFSLSYLEILDECALHVRKILKTNEKYYFNQWHIDKDNSFIRDFFGNNISVQAIVGKNGCGKSTLFEMIIRLVNNFAYKLFHNEQANSHSMKLSYVYDVYADLGFIVDGMGGCIKGRGDTMAFVLGNMKYAIGPKIEEFGDGFTYCEIINNDLVLDITKNFFYTLVVNYSIHAFYEKNYVNDRIEKGQPVGFPWIKCLYHKNDGYRIPVVLNPYRDNGTLNMRAENYLNETRLMSILKYSENAGLEFIENYRLNNICFNFNPGHVLQKFTVRDIGGKNELKEEDRNATIVSWFKEALKSPNSYARCILEAYDFKYTGREDDFVIIGYLYIVYKVLNIAGTYPSYSDYIDFSKKYLCFAKETGGEKGVWEPCELVDLVNDLRSNTSHITLKLRQTEFFLRHYDQYIVNNKLLSNGFDYNGYYQILNREGVVDKNDLDDIIAHLPPPFFSHEILLDRFEDDVKVNENPISLNLLSSGEMQMMLVLSGIVSHCRNILSITEKDRVKYRCINLMLDEIELCFHPDYQRQFLYNLISVIERMKMNMECGFNILLSTHSPFILSDIPQENILYLDNGNVVNDRVKINPFCANINDILYQSFFLDNGFMGEYVRRKVLGLVDYLENGVNDNCYWNAENARMFISSIGEPLVKNQLMEMYRDSKSVEKEDKVKLYMCEIKRIREEQ